MDPERQRLDRSPRSLQTDAFFTADRSTTPVSRAVNQIEVESNGKDRVGAAPKAVSFPGFKNQHAVTTFSEANPLPHARKTAAKDGKIDLTMAKWKHNADYTCFFSQAARSLSPTSLSQPHLQVKLLFGTGSEYYRHGVCGAVENAAQPTLLIVIAGIEPQYEIEFWNPANPAEKRLLTANNRWGVGITIASVEKAIASQYGRVINYDISVCAAFSTGYLGLQDSLSNALFPLDRLERVIVFDCLYATMKTALDRVKSVKGSTHIIAYVVTEGGNSFQKNQAASFDTLALGRIPTWNYVNLMGNVGFHAVTSARLVSEAQSPAVRIVDHLPPAYQAALNELVAKLPARNSVVSNEALLRKVKGSLPAGSMALATFTADKANGTAIRAFFGHVNTTRHCIGRAQLLGWSAPPGEEWHDMLLVEFAWEYLT